MTEIADKFSLISANLTYARAIERNVSREKNEIPEVSGKKHWHEPELERLGSVCDATHGGSIGIVGIGISTGTLPSIGTA